MITSFNGRYAFLSNFFDSPFKAHNRLYPTVEHYYQSEKAIAADQRRYIIDSLTPAQAKKRGRATLLDPEFVGIEVMARALKFKFDQHEDLAKKLMATDPHLLVEGNNWGDTRWGAVWRDGQWVGENWLGRLLMMERAVRLAT